MPLSYNPLPLPNIYVGIYSFRMVKACTNYVYLLPNNYNCRSIGSGWTLYCSCANCSPISRKGVQTIPIMTMTKTITITFQFAVKDSEKSIASLYAMLYSQSIQSKDITCNLVNLNIKCITYIIFNIECMSKITSTFPQSVR